jgi:hypothetical protein
LFLLLIGQDLVELLVDELLQFVELLFLFRREIEPLLQERRQNLAGSRRTTPSHSATARTTGAATRTAGPSRSVWAARWRTALGRLGSRHRDGNKRNSSEHCQLSDSHRHSPQSKWFLR